MSTLGGGTEISNPACSSDESANHRFRSHTTANSPAASEPERQRTRLIPRAGWRCIAARRGPILLAAGLGEWLFDRQTQPQAWRSRRSGDGCPSHCARGYVREHSHTPNQEILFCFEGKGTIQVDGVPHPFVPGTTVYAGPGVKHKIINDGPGRSKHRDADAEEFHAPASGSRTTHRTAPCVA